ncbi:hypothetical protein BXZ70DRAFT_83831 [Cristinia sonorae]|uniref:WW domain-containing protein n=1 Tax=Cristinia sonorae TaxID=1940300 RepID=A0A8K0XRJ9_9AGAR|nr:hypothetical protein BXZ70DRAFT_83831 [Cristinia sonorae]
MDDDTEVLDWGNEEDELQTGHFQDDGRDDEEDAVSLGGDEDDAHDFIAYQAHSTQDTAPVSSSQTPQHFQSEPSPQPSAHERDFSQSGRDSPSKRSQSSSFGQLKHALPPKPVLVAPEYVRPTPPQTSTLAGPMVLRDRRSNGHAKGDSHSNDDSLPPEWEVRHPRTGGNRDVYYYNVKTHESTWVRPAAAGAGRSSPSKDRELSAPRSPLSVLPDTITRSQPSDRNSATRGRRRRRPSDSLTFGDRHYRPGEAAESASGVDDLAVSRPRDRPVSPTGGTDRRARSLTPPRDSDISGYARRPRSRSPSPLGHTTRRDTQREVMPSRLSPTLERDRDRTRGYSNTSAEDTRSASPDGRSQRGRRLPVDLSPPRPPSHLQDQNDRRNDSREWSSAPHSTLSASYPPTSRIRRLYSFRGGGCLCCGRLEKPRESSYTVPPIFLRLCPCSHLGRFSWNPFFSHSSLYAYPSGLNIPCSPSLCYRVQITFTRQRSPIQVQTQVGHMGSRIREHPQSPSQSPKPGRPTAR